MLKILTKTSTLTKIKDIFVRQKRNNCKVNHRLQCEILRARFEQLALKDTIVGYHSENMAAVYKQVIATNLILVAK